MTTKNKQGSKAAGKVLGQEFTIIREFAAPRELVWRACTESAHLAQWWGPKGFTAPVCEWDARPGGKIYVVMRGPGGQEYPMGGEFREIQPPGRLVTMNGALDEKGDYLFQFLHTLTLIESQGNTKLTMHSRVIQATSGAGRYIAGFEMGMTLSLERLAEHLAQKTEPFVVERTLAAPAALVWRALTNLADLKEWYFELKSFRAEPGFEYEFTVEKNGVTYCHRCKVVEVIPEKRLAYTWRYEGHPGDSLVSLDLIAEGAQTRLKLTHLGLESFPPVPDFARKNFATGWTYLLGTSLKEFLETKANQPATQINESTKDREIVITRDFDVPRELVWEAMANPKHVANWWGPQGFTTTIETMDFREGGAWNHVMQGPDGAKYPNYSVFKKIVKPERIEFSQGGRREGGPCVAFEATWTFEALAVNRTRLTARMVFPSAEKRDVVVKEFGAIEGGRQTLERLAVFLVGLQAAQRVMDAGA